MNNRYFYLIFLIFLFQIPKLSAQDLAPCGERDYLTEYPRVMIVLWCLELPIPTTDEWDFTALAISPTGKFYATRPHRGEVVQLVDTNADSMPDTVEVLVGNLRLPNGLALDGESLYILGDGFVYRYQDSELSIIRDDLPSGRGFMARAITILEQRIYIGIPFPCDFCEAENELYGTVLSMALDGTDEMIVARGLRYPSALAFYQDSLWVTDSARDALSINEPYDEMNRIEFNGDVPHFGFPYCIGLNNQPDLEGDFDCSTASAPTLVFRSHSNPNALEVYDSPLFPWVRGWFLVVLSGSFDNSFIRGYSLLAVRPLPDGRIANDVMIPRDDLVGNYQVFYSEDGIVSANGGELINLRGAGVWPHRMLDVAVSPEGWIYLSVGGEGLYVLRQGNFTSEEVCRRFRECD